MAGTSPTSAASSALPITKLINNGTTSGTTGGTSSTTSSDASITSQLGPSAFSSIANHAIVESRSHEPHGRYPGRSLSSPSFSALQASDNLETSFANFQSNFAVLQSSQLIGATVTVNTTDASGNSSSLTGVVQGITVVNGVPQMTLENGGTVITGANGAPETFTTSQITGIQ